MKRYLGVVTKYHNKRGNQMSDHEYASYLESISDEDMKNMPACVQQDALELDAYYDMVGGEHEAFIRQCPPG